MFQNEHQQTNEQMNIWLMNYSSFDQMNQEIVVSTYIIFFLM